MKLGPTALNPERYRIATGNFLPLKGDALKVEKHLGRNDSGSGMPMDSGSRVDENWWLDGTVGFLGTSSEYHAQLLSELDNNNLSPHAQNSSLHKMIPAVPQ